MKRIILTAVAAAAVLTGGVVAAAPAFASNGPAQFVTHAPDHPDTTSLVNPVPIDQQKVIQTPNGPVWASDDLTVKLVPVALAAPGPGGANYRVDVTVNGSFHGFADPNTGAALESNGPVTGSISYYVQSNGQLPSGANLPAQEAGGINGTHLSQMVTQLFGPGASIVGGGDQYLFSYQNGAYTQDTTGTQGSVRGH